VHIHKRTEAAVQGQGEAHRHNGRGPPPCCSVCRTANVVVGDGSVVSDVGEGGGGTARAGDLTDAERRRVAASMAMTLMRQFGLDDDDDAEVGEEDEGQGGAMHGR
jgi:hypothetical protein